MSRCLLLTKPRSSGLAGLVGLARPPAAGLLPAAVLGLLSIHYSGCHTLRNQ